MKYPETRHSLIVRLKSEHDELAWREFVEAYEPFLQRMVSRQGVPDRHIPDVVQQILLAIARSVDSWSDDGKTASFRRWVATVSRNIVIRFMTRERKQAGGQGGTSLVDLLQDVPGRPNDGQIDRYEHELIVWAAEQVKDEFVESSWTAFWLTVVEGRSVKEVAEDLQITPGSIYMSRSRIIARVRKKVSEVLDCEPKS
jgi:RNA polymerase sigma-70 factor (ECF subfamily)